MMILKASESARVLWREAKRVLPVHRGGESSPGSRYRRRGSILAYKRRFSADYETGVEDQSTRPNKIAVGRDRLLFWRRMPCAANRHRHRSCRSSNRKRIQAVSSVRTGWACKELHDEPLLMPSSSAKTDCSRYHPHSQHLIAQGWWIAMGHLRRGCRWRHSRRAARCSSTPGSSSSCGALFSSSAGCLAAAGGECHPSVCVVAAQGWHRRARPPPTRTARFAGAVTARGPWRKRGPPAHALRLAAAARLPPKHATTLSTKIVVGRGGKCQGWQNGTPD